MTRLTNEEIFDKAVRYMTSNRKGRINMYRTELLLGLTYGEKIAFTLWLKQNHPDMLMTNPKVAGKSADQSMYLPGIFQIVCEPTGRRLIGSTTNTVMHAKNVYLSYIRSIDTHHKQNLWQRSPQAVADIKMYGISAFKFELLKTLPIGMDRKEVAIERQKIIDMFTPESLYQVDLSQMKKAKLEHVLKSDFDSEAKAIAQQIEELTAVKNKCEQNIVSLFQQRLNLDCEMKAAPKQTRSKFYPQIKEVNRQKKIVKLELEKTKKQLTLLRRDLNRKIEEYEIVNLRPVGRPKD